MGLQRASHVLLRHGKDDHLIVGQKIMLNGAGKRQAMELRTIRLEVIHRENLDAVSSRASFRALGIEPGRRSHVETLRGANTRRIVHKNERRRAVVRALDTRCPVSLIAKNEVERRGPSILCTGNKWKRVIRAEDDRHRFGARVPESVADRRQIGRDRNLQFLEGGVLVSPTGTGIRADADIAMGYSALLRPLAHRLLEQRNRRDQVQDLSSRTGHGLGKAQRSKGLPGTAGHHELAAVMIRETPKDILERVLLMRAQGKAFAAPRQTLGAVRKKVRPIDRPISEVPEPEDLTRGLQALNGLLRVPTPLIASINHDSPRKRITRRRRNERVEVILRDTGTRGIELALDGAASAEGVFSDEIDSSVRTVEAWRESRPLRPKRDGRELVGIEGILTKIALHKALEESALLNLRTSLQAQVIQRLLKPGRHHQPPVDETDKKNAQDIEMVHSRRDKNRNALRSRAPARGRRERNQRSAFAAVWSSTPNVQRNAVERESAVADRENPGRDRRGRHHQPLNARADSGGMGNAPGTTRRRGEKKPPRDA